MPRISPKRLSGVFGLEYLFCFRSGLPRPVSHPSKAPPVELSPAGHPLLTRVQHPQVHGVPDGQRRGEWARIHALDRS